MILIAGATLVGPVVTADLEIELSRTTHSCQVDPTLSGVQVYCLDACA